MASMTFDVLAPGTDLHKSLLLEASAGTGKTFSIENLVVRLLLEGEEPLLIEEILCVTYTKAATHDLKGRIRANIERALKALSEKDFLHLPYLAELEGELAKKRLETALFCFDAAQIFTIHSFCLQMLRENLFEGDVALDSGEIEGNVPMSELRRLVRDFFRTGMQEGIYSAGQLKKLLDRGGGEAGTEGLEKRLVHTVTRGVPIVPGKSFSENYEAFRRGLKELKGAFEKEKLIEDFLAYAPKFQKEEKKEGFLKEKEPFFLIMERGECTAEEFDDLLNIEIDPEKLNKGKVHGYLNYPDLCERLKKPLLKPHSDARSENKIFAQMAAGCYELVQRHLEEEEKLTFDDILKKMGRAVCNPAFAARVKRRYRAAVVDEFQDTDPLQWEIFRTLFSEGRLYLVGDPKQSIYAFRRADIYTYLKAKSFLDRSFSLDTNFRSQAPLIEALNLLFSEENAPELIALPKSGGSLPYRPVNPSGRVEPDGKPPVHFIFAGDKEKAIFTSRLEKEAFFPFIRDELIALHLEEKVSFAQCALLVKDHKQAAEIALFLKEAKIPCVRQKSGSIAASQALLSLRDLLTAVLSPRDDSAVKAALGTPLMGFTFQEVAELREELLEKLMLLRKALFEEGFAQFFEQLLLSCWHGDEKSVAERLLMREGGLEFWNDLQQIADLLMQHQSEKHPAPDALLAYLDQFEILEMDEEERFKKRADPDAEAVRIMTIHSSKGLEFDYVFALGLIKGSHKQEELVPEEEGESVRLVAADSGDPLFLQHNRELEAEKVRQLYVAMTRAAKRLYVPVALKKERTISPGKASPMELFLMRFREDLKSFAGSRPDLFAVREPRIREAAPSLPPEEPPPLRPPEEVFVPQERYVMESFTSLSKGHAPLELDLSPPKDFFAKEKTPYTLPAGSETGNILHKLLEELSFQCGDLRAYVERQLQNSRYLPWADCLTAMLESALQAPLDGFCLRDLPDEACFRETEFIYPRREGSLKGVIDLFFTFNGKYYLLDWKSNWLGPESAAYGREALERAMDANCYHLQADLYKEALRRYLKLVDPREFEEIYGGAYYLFLRGLQTPPCGVYEYR